MSDWTLLFSHKLRTSTQDTRLLSSGDVHRSPTVAKWWYTTQMETSTPSAGWLRGPLWDVGLVAFGWLPFYVWAAGASFGDNTWFTTDGAGFTAAVALALALNFAHRQYVLILVYGDRAALAARPIAYVLAPIIAFGVVAGAYWTEHAAAKLAILVVLGVWNAWHVIQQRYGILRAYSAKAKGGLESRSSARIDRALIWSSVFLMMAVLAVWRLNTLEGIPQATILLIVVRKLLEGAGAMWILGGALAIWLAVAARWVHIERKSTPASRGPRWIFLGSTFALFGVFVVHGPVMGYLVMGVAHSIEYVAFVHVHGEKKYNRAKTNLAALLVGSIPRAPLILAPLLASYVFLYQHRYALAYVTYYTTTSILHYLYDGWIWRTRKPSAAAPLPARTSAEAA